MIAYAISDSTTLNFQNLQNSLHILSKQANMVVYRDKHNPDYSINAKAFVAVAKELGFDKILLHSDIELAFKLRADGVHLTSTQLSSIATAKSLGLFVIASTHTIGEALDAETLGADMVTLSPVYDSPNKGNPIGVKMLEDACKAIRIPVVALGGILTMEQIRECENAGAYGFASIRYFAN